MNDIKIDILDIPISFFADNHIIIDYIAKEFENQYLHRNKNILQTDVNVNIYSNKKFKFIIKENINDSVFVDKEGNVMQIIRAKGRRTFVIYSQEFKEISVYIPYKIKNNSINKLFNPKYLNKWQDCLVDFIHGPFIGIIENFLLKNGHTFVHGSSFSYGNLGYVFCGKAQVGKTEIAKALHHDAKILSDDLTILTNRNSIYPYQKSIGIFSENMNFDKYFKRKKEIDIIIEKINLRLFKVLSFLRLRSKRILFFKEVFENSYTGNGIDLKRIFYISREKDYYKVEKFDYMDFVKKMVEILENEFNNLQNFWTILDLCTNFDKEKFMIKIEDCLRIRLNNANIFIIYIPFFNNKYELESTMKKIILNALNESGDNYENK